MRDEEILQRPVGWWVKEADARLDAAFDVALAGRGMDRRGWQVLATLHRCPTPAARVVAALSSFDHPAAVYAAIDDLHQRGWVEDADGALRLTDEGAREHDVLAPLVQDVRRQVAAALPQDDYATLVRLLARLVDALPGPTR